MNADGRCRCCTDDRVCAACRVETPPTSEQGESTVYGCMGAWVWVRGFIVRGFMVYGCMAAWYVCVGLLCMGVWVRGFMGVCMYVCMGG